MWYVCKLTFAEGQSSGIESSTYAGIRQGMEDVINEWGRPKLIGVNLQRIHPIRIKQGRMGEYVQDYMSEGVR